VPTALPVLVTSLDGTQFSEVCETLVVNAHGCAILTRVKLDAGASLHLHSKDGREATAHVVSCQPTGPDHRNWRLGARLDQPQNFWGLKDCPKDWAVSAFVQPRVPQTISLTTALAAQHVPASANQPSQAVLDRVARQLESKVTRMIAESVHPLQVEVSALKDKLARREANPSRFEVSLSSIPPEVEQQLELRLRQDLGPRVLDEARQQAQNLLAAAKSAIDQKTTEGSQDFMQRVAEELKLVEKRAQDLSAHISDNAREHMRRGLDDFHQKLLEGGNSLKRLSEDLLAYLQQNLNDEHDARRGDLDQLRASLGSESSRLHEQIERLESRIAKLDESARDLESGLDQRLGQMSSNLVRETGDQLEGVANDIFEELTKRSSAALANQLEEANGNMKIVQKGIVASASESVKADAANALQAFEQSMEKLSNYSIERCRCKLADGLNAVVKNLGEHFQVAAESSDRGSEGVQEGPDKR
jgi:predicted nuclease with TOPRIM domain